MDQNVQCVQHFETDLHISAAVLDVESLPASCKKGIQVWLECGNRQHLITNLCRQTKQCTLDIGFSKGESVVFSTKGQGSVHLHGYFVPDDENENK